METEEKTTPWNVAFLVRDFPAELRVVGPWHFMGTIDEPFVTQLKAVTQEQPLILHFLGQHKPERFIWVGFRVEGERRLDAIAAARHRLEGLIDGASLWELNDSPEISGFAWVGPAEDANLSVALHHRQIWIEMVAAPSESAEAWRMRNDELRARVIRFFSFAIDQHSRANTPLARQVRYSMRMFRHGKQSGSWGVEFICKFCALEGLVCGDEKSKKRELLTKRLTTLFRDQSAEFVGEIDKLWDYRNNAVHTARAFDGGRMEDGAPLGVNIAGIEHLFAGALVFAIEHLVTSDSIADLWKQADTFQLPEFARLKRPKDLPLYAAPNFEVGIGVTMAGGGTMFRDFLRMGRLRYEEANPHLTGTNDAGEARRT